LSYDQNGNITTLTRNGDLDSDTSVIAIDNLIYNYDDKYRLKKVTDFTGNSSGFKEGADNEDEYGYDKYGNMTRDDNKDITSITYNHLNLPKEIIFEDDENKKIIYLYNANGQKIKKTIFNSPNVSTVNYQSVFHYENGLLRFLTTAEGYVNFTTEGYNYIYNYTDHLGNIRVSYFLDLRTRSVAIIEENNYYPFGLKHNGYNNISPPNSVYKYKYNGKELQDELGLNVYDFGARNYMPDLGRWANIDPLAEQSRRWTPYNYAYNNPVYFIDPDGMQSDSNSGSSNISLGSEDIEAMVDVGYGRKVVVREKSSDGRSTLEIQDGKRKQNLDIIKLKIKKKMKITSTIQKWQPVVNDFPKSIFIVGLYDDSKSFRIICRDIYSQRKFKFIFDEYIAYRNSDEGARLKSHNLFPSNSREWCLFKTDNSEFINWIIDESTGIYSSNEIIHYFFRTSDDIIEVLSLNEPKCQEVMDNDSDLVME